MEPTPPEPGAATGSPHGLIVEGREELLYLLGEAAEEEQNMPALANSDGQTWCESCFGERFGPGPYEPE